MGIIEAINIINKRIGLICENTSYDLEVYDSSEELRRIGSKDEYRDYLNTVFPDTSIDRIVYHGTNHYNYIVENGFKIDSIKRWNLGLGINFMFDRSSATEYGSDVVCCKVNIRNYIDNVTAGFEPLRVSGVIEKRVNDYFSKKLDTDFNFNKENIYPSEFFDHFVNNSDNISDALTKLESLGIDGTIGKLNRDIVITVTNPNNIHILGSQKDIAGFSGFVGK